MKRVVFILLYVLFADVVYAQSHEEKMRRIHNGLEGSTQVSKCYHRGKAASKVKLLHQEMQLAYVGSPLALENASKNLMDMEDDE